MNERAYSFIKIVINAMLHIFYIVTIMLCVCCIIGLFILHCTGIITILPFSMVRVMHSQLQVLLLSVVFLWQSGGLLHY